MVTRRFMRRALLFAMVISSILTTHTTFAASPEHHGGAHETTLFLIDRTTAYDAVDSKDLDRGLSAAIMSLDADEQFIVRTITDDAFASTRVFAGVRPGCVFRTWWDKLRCSDLAAKPKLVRFYRSVIASVRSLRTSSQHFKRSEIFETIAELSNEYRDANVRRVIVFSDLLENSTDLPTPFVLGTRPSLVIQRLNSKNLAAHFPGANVIVFGVGRSDKMTRTGISIAKWQDLRSIWTTWFKAGGARSVEIYQWYPSSS